MVYSKLDSELFYPNIKTIYPEDKKKKSSIYEIEILDTPVYIVIGEMKTSEYNSNIIYFPIYLVKNNNKVTQIGLYEITREEYNSHIDDIEDYLSDPLLHDFVDLKYLLETAKLVKSEESDESEDEVNEETSEIVKLHIPDLRKDIFSNSLDNKINTTKLVTESEIDAKDIREKYKEQSTDIWIKKWLKNKNYSIKDNEAGGDCLFSTIRDAFESIGQETTINQLRQKLAIEVNEDVYKNYKEMYEMLGEQIKHTTTESIKQKNDIDKIQKSLKSTISIEQKKQLINQAKKIKQDYEKLKVENKLSKDLLNEFKIMKNVKNIDDFKEKIQTCDFWADDWAISTLERILNIKFIILSSERYSEKDYTSVLQCSNIIDPTIEELGYFSPEYYIIIEHTGDHYKLVGYKKKYIFTFSELPYDLKRIIVDKCMQSEAGLFNMILDFKTFQGNLLRGGNPVLSIDYQDINESNLKKLFNDEIILGIHPNGSTRLPPGKARSEKMEPYSNIFEFIDLHCTPNWRRCLSREYLRDFELDGYTWPSVEHYYQANKYKDDTDFYKKFTNDNGNFINDIMLVKAMGSQDGKYKGEIVREKKIPMDNEFYGFKQKGYLKKANKAKFSQNEDLLNMLINTNNAKLIRLKKAAPSELYDELMIVRDELK